MLTSVSTLTPRARLQANVAPAATAFSAVLLRHRQQTRSFRFGGWPENGARDQHRDMRRRCKVLRHKGSDALSRKRLWGMSPSCRATGHRDWQPKRFFAFSKQWAGGSRSDDHQAWDAPFENIRSYMVRRQSEMLREAGFSTRSNSLPAATAQPSARASNTTVEADNFVIDPITNRKVSKLSVKSTPDETVLQSANKDLPVRVSSKSSGLQASPDLSSISDSSETCYMSWKYKGVFSGSDGANTVLGQTTADFPGSPNVFGVFNYDDLHKYKPVLFNEPDGNRPKTVSIEDPEELEQYKPVTWNEPDGKPTEPPAEIGHEGYNPEEVEKYRPVHWNEPDGQPTEPPVEIGHDGYDPKEVARYKPVRWNEPDGQPTEPPVEIGRDGYDPEEVAKYKPFYWNEPDGQPTEPVELGYLGYDPAEVQQYKPFKYNEPDGKPTTPPVEIGHEGYDPAEVQQYKPFKYNEPDGKPTTPPVEIGHEGYDPEEVQSYKPFKYNEPDGKPTTPPAEIGHEGYDPEEVQSYKPFKYNEPDGKPLSSAADSASGPSDLESYGAVRYQEPDGKPEASVDRAAESLREYDQRAEASETSNAPYAKILRSLSVQALEGASSSSGTISAASKQPLPTREMLESALVRMNAEADAVDQLARATVKASQSRFRRRLSEDERKQALADPYSTEPQGLETAFAEECAATNTWPAYAKIHKAVPRQDDTAAEQPAAPAPGSAPKPTVLYKVLAYDPTTQSVHVAETTSTVPDMATPLAPGEVLLRLSHPAKFAPHLKPLQKEGFEIVSGSGDVLVFREMGRDNNGASSRQRRMAAVAPVVDSVSSSSADAATPSLHNTAKMNKTVRREEVVFSGTKARTAERAPSDQKTASLGKRVVVGATWVAGVSYALGVVGEYVKGR